MVCWHSFFLWLAFHTIIKQFSLFSADLLQALGGSMELKWINDGFVQIGPVCTAQGFLQNIGQSGIAITTLVSVFLVSILY